MKRKTIAEKAHNLRQQIANERLRRRIVYLQVVAINEASAGRLTQMTEIRSMQRLCRAGLMAILLVIGVMNLRAMAVIAAVITVERLAPASWAHLQHACPCSLR
jgi:hypothetical protein